MGFESRRPVGGLIESRDLVRMDGVDGFKSRPVVGRRLRCNWVPVIGALAGRSGYGDAGVPEVQLGGLMLSQLSYLVQLRVRIHGPGHLIIVFWLYFSSVYWEYALLGVR